MLLLLLFQHVVKFDNLFPIFGAPYNADLLNLPPPRLVSRPLCFLWKRLLMRNREWHPGQAPLKCINLPFVQQNTVFESRYPWLSGSIRVLIAAKDLIAGSILAKCNWNTLHVYLQLLLAQLHEEENQYVHSQFLLVLSQRHCLYIFLWADLIIKNVNAGKNERGSFFDPWIWNSMDSDSTDPIRTSLN